MELEPFCGMGKKRSQVVQAAGGARGRRIPPGAAEIYRILPLVGG